MRHSGLLRTAAAVLIATAAAPGLAADPDLPARGPIPFESMDADHNGFVSEAEFSQAHTARMQNRNAGSYLYRNMNEAPRYTDLDTDHDGRVSREEFQAYHQQHMLQRRQQNMERYQERTQWQQQRLEQPGGGMGPDSGTGGGNR